MMSKLIRGVATRIKALATRIAGLAPLITYPIRVLSYSIRVCLQVARYTIFLAGVIAIGLSIHVYQLTHHERIVMPTSRVNAQIEDIYSKIRKATDQVGKVPPIYMLETLPSYFIPNAYVDEYGIYMTHAMANVLKEHPDALAIIIGHEIAHSLMHHTNGMNILIRDSSAADELMSDGYGAFLAAKAGYNVCEGAKFFLAMSNVYGDNLDSSHPPNIVRYKHLQMDYCIDKS